MPLVSADESGRGATTPSRSTDDEITGAPGETSLDEASLLHEVAREGHPSSRDVELAGRPARPIVGPHYVVVPPRREPERVSRLTRRLLFAIASAALVLAVPALALFGSQVALDAREGEIVDVIADPSAPGYQALVVPTPTSLMVHRTPAGNLAGVALLVSGSDAGGGAVVRLPVATVVDGDELTLADAYGSGGADAVHEQTQQLLGMAIDSVVDVDRARWAQLVAPVSPLNIVNTDELVELGADGSETVVFPAGELSLRAQDAARFLELRVVGESEAAHQHRIELFWRAWLDAVAASSDPTVVPGEADSGLGRFIREMGGGYVRHEVLPVDPVEPLAPDREGDIHWRAQTEAVGELLVEVVPFPIGAQLGDRIRVRLLDGVGDIDGALGAAQLLVPAGVELTVFGNATAFDATASTIDYHRREYEADAARLADRLGAGSVRFVDRPDAIVDVTVTIGSDFDSERLGEVQRPNMLATEATPDVSSSDG